MDDARQLVRGALRLLLLERIARGETYGYALVVDLQGRGLSHATETTVYPALARMEKDGLLNARLEAAGRGAARKYYRLTAAGEAALARARAVWETLVRAVEDLKNEELPTGEGRADGVA